ncbi:MAG: hypothetical protein QGI83_03905, partial [Candidatus Latescibacteria bacterium]|nr:hypothetical protein [Candidatus Latescibacterota bacterium]
MSSSRVPNYRLLGLVLGLALLYRLVFWLPSWQPGDALGSYAFSAHKILTGEYAPGAQYTFEWFSGIRLGVVVPAALLVGLIGYS